MRLIQPRDYNKTLCQTERRFFPETSHQTAFYREKQRKKEHCLSLCFILSYTTMISSIAWVPKGAPKPVPAVADPPSKEEIEEMIKSGALEPR
jgi:hypothetical protein